jgi:hypothetical protein
VVVTIVAINIGIQLFLLYVDLYDFRSMQNRGRQGLKVGLFQSALLISKVVVLGYIPTNSLGSFHLPFILKSIRSSLFLLKDCYSNRGEIESQCHCEM